jgi:hypothetical protein
MLFKCLYQGDRSLGRFFTCTLTYAIFLESLGNKEISYGHLNYLVYITESWQVLLGNLNDENTWKYLKLAFLGQKMLYFLLKKCHKSTSPSSDICSWPPLALCKLLGLHECY